MTRSGEVDPVLEGLDSFADPLVPVAADMVEQSERFLGVLGGRGTRAPHACCLPASDPARVATGIQVDGECGGDFLLMPNTQVDELQPFVDSMSACPKSGLHNVFKNPERMLMYGEVSFKS